MGPLTTFDRLFAESAPLIQAGLHMRDTPPVEGGRWPVSVVLRPDPVSARQLETTMTEVEQLAGAGHLRTGDAGVVHFTVRVLERYREFVGEQDKAVRRYALAMKRAAREVGPIELDLVGLTLAPGSVMACAYPVDKNADRFMGHFRDELGIDAWAEAGSRRDIWYANILHFGADIAHPAKLVDWVECRRELRLGQTLVDTAELVRFRYEQGALGRLMRPEVLAVAWLGQNRTPDVGAVDSAETNSSEPRQTSRQDLVDIM